MLPAPTVSIARMVDDDPATIPPEVRRQAVEWLVELQSDVVSEDTRQRWSHWREAHPDHERAWKRVDSLGGKLQGLSSPLAHATLASPDAMRRRQVVKTLAVLLFAGGATWVVEERVEWRLWTADLRTGIGQRSDFTLPDGTRVQLNSGTAVDIRFTDSERKLQLMRGEIMVTTAPDPQAAVGSARPFLVQTAYGRLRALGTRFLVHDLGTDRKGPGLVAVYEGAVEIRPDGKQAAPHTLQAGEQARFTQVGIVDVLATDDRADAWLQGLIVAQDMPLADFLDELGRHRQGRLACDPAIAGLKVTGTYPLADTDHVLSVLETTLPLEIHRITRFWVTVRGRSS